MPACLKVLVVIILVKVIRDEYFGNYKYDEKKMYISVEYVDKYLHAMKPGKAAGCDGIETEQMVNAHLIRVSILVALFNEMIIV